MIISIDTNIIVYIVAGDSEYGNTALDLFKKYASRADFAVCPAVYAELSAFFSNKKLLDKFLFENNIRLLSLSVKALHLAGVKWLEYNKKRKTLCPECGSPIKITCKKCGKPMKLKQHIISDFMIGAFSLIEADKLLTLDKGIYKAYFPDLQII